MIVVHDEIQSYAHNRRVLKNVIKRSSYPKVEIGFDFAKVTNRKAVTYIYFEPNKIEELQKEIKDFQLLCLRFCEVV